MSRFIMMVLKVAGVEEVIKAPAYYTYLRILISRLPIGMYNHSAVVTLRDTLA